jgi:hypothetical protein
MAQRSIGGLLATHQVELQGRGSKGKRWDRRRKLVEGDIWIALGDLEMIVDKGTCVIFQHCLMAEQTRLW